MNDSKETRARFATIMTTLGEVYGKTPSKLLLKAYWTALRRFEVEDLERAAAAHLQDTEAGQYFPKPADFIRILEGDRGSNALVAWSKVQRALESVGTWDSVAFDDPVIHLVLEDMGGWLALGSMTVNEQPFRAQEFTKRYQGYASRDALPPGIRRHLVGRTEHENVGFVDGPAVRITLIGDKDAARAVLAGDNPRMLQAAQVVPLPNLRST